MYNYLKKFTLIPLLVTVITVNFLALPAMSAVISTQTVLNQQNSSKQTEVQAFLAREDVRSQMVMLGVNPDDVNDRIASLTDQELAQLQQHINDMPAGSSSALVVLGAIFLILLVLELVGVTNVFSKI